ncbi:urease accessory UreF family protein [Actinomycetospora sp. NBRC 106378]|uniref:urease accessory protein UreF n=1 Tax=Actinomycetospora sp. NBRC 106378 TaxID=3032208 RepID=UPI0024A5E787|nr:urease accessory UreF family protein [Actinomycetospora sp. NBRC 106378]GLZ53873.1 urease accessory protein UreF [Actinomycetospora sp. NBRC 106378]
MLAPDLWLLADSRLPTGGHAHSGGIEAAVRRGLVRAPDDVAAWLAGRVPTTGLVTAAAAAAACALVADRPEPDWTPWDAALSARTPVAALREVSRQQGRAMLRTVRAAWPTAAVDRLGTRPHQALVLGVTVAAAGGAPHDAAALAVHHLVGQVCSAAVRLLGLDPLALAGVHARALAEHGPVVGKASDAGTAAALADDPDLLPTATIPLPEVLAVLHVRSEGALFAS